MNIDERLAISEFPLPAIREINLAKHSTGISLGLGELKSFPVDKQITDALTASLFIDGTSYTHNAGLPKLREAIAHNHNQQDNFNYTLDNVIITIGVQNALYSTIKTLAKLGAKRVLIPEIYFGIYRKIPLEFNLEVLSYKLTSDFGIDLNALEELLMPNDIVLLNSPANPTGRVLSSSEQKELAELFNNKLTEGYIISDEIYSKLIYSGEVSKSFSCFFKRTIVVNGISKSGAVAGLRVGWIITRNKLLAKAITSNNATAISSPPTANQYAALPVVQGKTQTTINEYNSILKKNSDYVSAKLKELNIPFTKPTGSFYIFPNLSSILGSNTKEFCIEAAKKENGVVVIPGVAFGTPSYIRISLASNKMEEGMERFTKAIKTYLNK